MNIAALLSIILTLFCLMATGFLCRKLGVITNEASKGLSKLILWVGQPMLILTALEKVEYNTENLTVGWQVTLIGFVMHFLLCIFVSK